MDAENKCKINDVGIVQCINLKSLNAAKNQKITNVNHLAKLEILYAYDDCGINDAGISQCINLE